MLYCFRYRKIRATSVEMPLDLKRQTEVADGKHSTRRTARQTANTVAAVQKDRFSTILLSKADNISFCSKRDNFCRPTSFGYCFTRKSNSILTNRLSFADNVNHFKKYQPKLKGYQCSIKDRSRFYLLIDVALNQSPSTLQEGTKIFCMEILDTYTAIVSPKNVQFEEQDMCNNRMP